MDLKAYGRCRAFQSLWFVHFIPVLFVVQSTSHLRPMDNTSVLFILVGVMLYYILLDRDFSVYYDYGILAGVIVNPN